MDQEDEVPGFCLICEHGCTWAVAATLRSFCASRCACFTMCCFRNIVYLNIRNKKSAKYLIKNNNEWMLPFAVKGLRKRLWHYQTDHLTARVVDSQLEKKLNTASIILLGYHK
jgi:hypothetical protein